MIWFFLLIGVIFCKERSLFTGIFLITKGATSVDSREGGITRFVYKIELGLDLSNLYTVYLIYAILLFLTEFKKICASWKTDSWLWFRIFITDMIIYQARHTADQI